jgi:hypothetical protein
MGCNNNIFIRIKEKIRIGKNSVMSKQIDLNVWSYMRLQLALILIFSLLTFSVQASTSELKMISTMDILNENSSALAREDIISFMKSEKVQNELVKQGVNPAEALKRVATLSNSEVKNLSDQIKKAQAGGDFGVGSIIGAFVFIFIVLLITDILGLTKVFSFTRSIRQ